MVKSVDTRDLKSLGRKAVRVQVPLRAPEAITNPTNNYAAQGFSPVFLLVYGLAAGAGVAIVKALATVVDRRNRR